VLTWQSAWSWAGGQYSVKSYPNVVVETKDSGAGLVTDVAYDLFSSSTIGGSEEYEVMIWLGNFNAGPIARSVGAFIFMVLPY
jgi:xyloglucan-specific endo-beta-1,4-glucanase